MVRKLKTKVISRHYILTILNGLRNVWMQQETPSTVRNGMQLPSMLFIRVYQPATLCVYIFWVNVMLEEVMMKL